MKLTGLTDGALVRGCEGFDGTIINFGGPPKLRLQSTRILLQEKLEDAGKGQRTERSAPMK